MFSIFFLEKFSYPSPKEFHEKTEKVDRLTKSRLFFQLLIKVSSVSNIFQLFYQAHPKV